MPRIRIPLTPEEDAERAKAKLLGTDKLAKGNWRLALDATGHSAIALGAALLAVLGARFLHWRAWVCIMVGMGLGFAALTLREGIQWATSGSPHLLDRALDIGVFPVGGAVGGLIAYLVGSRWLARREARKAAGG